MCGGGNKFHQIKNNKGDCVQGGAWDGVCVWGGGGGGE